MKDLFVEPDWKNRCLGCNVKKNSGYPFCGKCQTRQLYGCPIPVPSTLGNRLWKCRKEPREWGDGAVLAWFYGIVGLVGFVSAIFLF